MSVKRHLGTMLQRVPWLVDLGMPFYRLSRARFTAGVVGVILNGNGEFLVVKHIFHPREPWGLPGGWLGFREDPKMGLQREVREETGIKLKILQPLLVEQARNFSPHIDIAYLCETNETVNYLSAELLDFRWVTPESCPTLLPFHTAAVEAYSRDLLS